MDNCEENCDWSKKFNAVNVICTAGWCGIEKQNEYRYRKKNTGNIEYTGTDTGIFTDQIFAKFKRFLVRDVSRKTAQNVINSSCARSHNAGHGLKSLSMINLKCFISNFLKIQFIIIDFLRATPTCSPCQASVGLAAELQSVRLC